MIPNRNSANYKAIRPMPQRNGIQSEDFDTFRMKNEENVWQTSTQYRAHTLSEKEISIFEV